MKRLLRFSLLGILFLIVLVTVNAFSAANLVSESGADARSFSISPNDLKPPECATLVLDNLVTGTGTINGTAANDLILGSSAVDTINGGDGTDCILGGDGDDVISGDGADDILDGGGGADICNGGDGADTFFNCETQNDP